MKVLVTGANGFIGKNLILRLNELGINTLAYTRSNSIDDLSNFIGDSDVIVHLAGENRPVNEEDFDTVNIGLTHSICESIRSVCKIIPVIFASSTQVGLDNSYGRSKLNAELLLKEFEHDTGNRVYIFRLPGVFGKWCRPNYNSVVATFCHNISQNIPIKINDPSYELTLVYIDDVVDEFVRTIQDRRSDKMERSVRPEYKIELAQLAKQIKLFKDSRDSLISERVGGGLIRKLYSTYVSYFSPKQFAYPIPSYGDERGMFAEVFKSKDSGQVSFFTAKPGITRGGHYHHSKTEKFLVIQGLAKFCFKHMVSAETHEITTSVNRLEIVETVPGWSHDITNIGEEEMVVILWANELFDPNNPDTVAHTV